MSTLHDYLIVGAGPAGVQLGYYLQQRERDYLILEQADAPGAFFAEHPRHRTLISINKVYTGSTDRKMNMRWDWNSLLSEDEGPLFAQYSQRYFPKAADLQRYLGDFAAHYGLQIEYGTKVVRVQKAGEGFVLTDSRGQEYRGKRLVIATGMFTPYLPDIPGVELCETYVSHSTDPMDYANKRVLVVGKGNSGFETADHLTETAATIHIISPASVRFAWQSHFVGHLRAVNNNFLDTYQLKSQNAVIDGTITRIERKNEQFHVSIAYTHANGQQAVVPYDHVIFCTGFQFDTSIFDDGCRPELTIHDRYPAQTTEWESVNVPNLYFAGTLMAACDYKKTMSGFIHGFRHNIRTLSHLLAWKHENTPWTHASLAATPEAVLTSILDRVNKGAGIFLQPNFLVDVLVLDAARGQAAYYEDVRRDYVADSWLAEHEHYFVISLEYGRFGQDAFSIVRDPDPEKGSDAPYLHPVIRCYRYDQLVAVHHIQDDLESDWYKEVYVGPAREFLKAQLADLVIRQPAAAQ